MSSSPTADQVSAALARVNDPEIHKPITDLGMVKNIGSRRCVPDGGGVSAA
jgi:ATP-binding protein involved in chromosome partitioning